MLIRLKNKDTLIVNNFKLKCCIGKNGLKKNKIEGDNCTPKGIFTFGTLYFRRDRVNNPNIKLKKKAIKPNMGWCNDSNHKNYNKEIIVNKITSSEKLFRKDHKYDYLIEINYNKKKIVPNRGSAIFIHLTKNYEPTAGCIALKKKDFLVLLKFINKKTRIKIS